jgi:hypothetical protein
MAKTKLLGTLALLLALVVGFVACDDGSTDKNSGGVKEAEITADNLEAAIAWFKDNASTGKGYVYKLDSTKNNDIVGSATLDGAVDTKIAGASIRLVSKDNNEAVVNLASTSTGALVDISSMFIVQGGAKLIVDKNVILQGYADTDSNGDDTTYPLVVVGDAGKFEMLAGSKLSGANNATGVTGTGAPGGGVFVGKNGEFVLDGGEISGNTAKTGAGVYVEGENAKFTMKSGEIKDNVLAASGVGGVGVYVKALAEDTGDATFVKAPTFTMAGGSITNTAASIDGAGGGVYVVGNAVDKAAVFNMTGGTISGHKLAATNEGGGVFVDKFGRFTQNGATAVIKDNSIATNAASLGGGVYVGGGTYVLNNGLVGGNSAGAGGSGGGVYAISVTGAQAIVTITGGTIGSAGDVAGNNAMAGGGLAVTGITGQRAVLTMKGGEIVQNRIAGNTTSKGGGVYLGNFADFELSANTDPATTGTINGNSALSGGGVFVSYNDTAANGATFTMNAGTIKANRAGILTGEGTAAAGKGAGIYVDGASDKTGAVTIAAGSIVTAADTTAEADKNLASDGSGNVATASGYAIFEENGDDYISATEISGGGYASYTNVGATAAGGANAQSSTVAWQPFGAACGEGCVSKA